MEEMYTGDCTYDIDNRDIEGEMIQQDIEEEEAELEAEEEKEAEEEQQQITKNYIKNRSILNAKNLILDLGRNEYDRNIYTWVKKSSPDISYSGKVVHQLDNDAFIFEVKTSDGKQLKKVRLSEVIQ
jgi:uncharacterized protein with gpF-like domain